MLIEKEWREVKQTLETTLDRVFGIASDATSEFDSVLTHDEINALGYVRNFPHLTCVMCSIEPEELPNFSKHGAPLNSLFRGLVADYSLLPATCYKVYLGLIGQDLSAERIESCIARCFRHEDKALDEYRAVNFTMKEYVYLGTPEGAQGHLTNGYAKLASIFDQLQIPIGCEVATDPFFDASSSVAKLSALMPTKREMVFNTHAVSSMNYHRNYFGEKFDIKCNAVPVHTSCVAFGIERWIAMFKEHFGTSGEALAALRRIA